MPSKVINSTPVSVALYPFLLLLFAWDTKEHAWLTMCSSNAVGAHWAITAAHCTDNLDARMYMFSGVTNASCIWTSTPAKMYEDCGDVLEYIWAADEVHTHNKYDSITLKNDISLLYYKTPVHMSRYPRITNSTPPIGTNLTVLGYGRYQLGSFDLSDGLRKGIVFILDGRDYPGLGTILPGQLVAGNFADPNDPNDNEDTCQGDSGSGMFTEGTSTVFVGITSWGVGCALDNLPGVYTDVPYYYDWILWKILTVDK